MTTTKLNYELADFESEYLDELRDSGVTNMFGAAPYLQSEFGYDKNKARAILQLWMETYRD